jgi:uncharacterized short protein YbdD (DUF466 family)
MKLFREARRVAWRGLRRFWSRLREWCGDAAYERYLRSERTGSSPSATLSAKEFYVEELDRRYSQINRCC